MNKTDILSALDEEISRLRQARDLLADASLPTRSASVAKAAGSPVSEPVVKRGPGRPKGSVSKPKSEAAPAKKVSGTAASKSASYDREQSAPKRRTMSPEGKARIAAAQRARWARQNGESAAKKTSASKPAGKKVAAKVAGGTKGAAKKAAPVKAAKTVKKAPVKSRGPYKKKSAVKASAKPAAESTAETATAAAAE